MMRCELFDVPHLEDNSPAGGLAGVAQLLVRAQNEKDLGCHVVDDVVEVLSY
jgi:hypothetical protein